MNSVKHESYNKYSDPAVVDSMVHIEHFSDSRSHCSITKLLMMIFYMLVFYIVLLAVFAPMQLVELSNNVKAQVASVLPK